MPVQDPVEPVPKKARTLDDYKPRTLKEIAAESDTEVGIERDGEEVLFGDLLPSRVRLTFKGSSRPLSQSKKTLIFHWSQRFAGDPIHYTKPYQTEMMFHEGNSPYLLVINENLLPRFEKEVKADEAVDVYVIRLGGIGSKGKREWVLLVEAIKAAGFQAQRPAAQ